MCVCVCVRKITRGEREINSCSLHDLIEGSGFWKLLLDGILGLAAGGVTVKGHYFSKVRASAHTRYSHPTLLY